MPVVAIYNVQGQQVGDLELNDSIFAAIFKILLKLLYFNYYATPPCLLAIISSAIFLGTSE